jgi:SAM-dependent methyltransferase
LDKLLEILKDALYKNTLLKFTASSPRKKDCAQKITLRQVLIQKHLQYQISTYHQEKVFHVNQTSEQLFSYIVKDILPSYKQILFSTDSQEYQILINKQLQPTLLKKNISTQLPVISHNRKKNRVLEEGTPIPFLIDLGIMSTTGKILPSKYDKFKQINRYLELVSDCLHALPKDKTLQIIDFGCGKAYLTFALYYFLTEKMHRSIHMLGLDLKKDVIDFCSKTAQNYGWDNLTFAVGDINEQQPQGKIDLVITLHACDTATDAALEKAVQWDADVILAVPCCQHELFNQIRNSALEPLLKHGILKERFAALVTDAARAQLLELQGYAVQVLEFIDMEHTPKNILLRAIKQKGNVKAQSSDEYDTFKKMLNITPSLEVRLNP